MKDKIEEKVEKIKKKNWIILKQKKEKINMRRWERTL